MNSEQLEQRQSKALGLVGYDTPQDAAALELGQQFGHVRKEPCFAAQISGVDREKFLAQSIVIGVLGRCIEAHAKQAACAVRGDRTRCFDRQLLQPARSAHAIERIAQVSGGIGKRAIEIKENGLNHVVRCETSALSIQLSPCDVEVPILLIAIMRGNA